MGMREPEIGEFLLFCVDDGGIHKKYRPFLVVSVVDGDSVSGEVFGDPLLDSKTKWALRLFQGLRLENRTQWVAGVLPGDGVGSWQFKEMPALPIVKPPKPLAPKSPVERAVPLAQVKGFSR